MKHIRVDIDNTICKTNGINYSEAIPIHRYIKKINELYDEGNYIVYWTSRGVGSGIDLHDLTKKQLDSWGCKYHELRLDKPVYDLFIDDKALTEINQLITFPLNESRNIIQKLDNFYENKKVCILGNGSSLVNHNIDFTQYDTVVGSNRIYKTKYASFINVYYNSMSKVEYPNFPDMLKTIASFDSFKHFYACPWSSGPQTRKFMINLFRSSDIKDHTYNKVLPRTVAKFLNKRPLTGISAIYHVLLSNPISVDLYGYDFYNTKYVNNLKKYKSHDRLHDLDSNKAFLEKMIKEHGSDKIRWFL